MAALQSRLTDSHFAKSHLRRRLWVFTTGKSGQYFEVGHGRGTRTELPTRIGQFSATVLVSVLSSP